VDPLDLFSNENEHAYLYVVGRVYNHIDPDGRGKNEFQQDGPGGRAGQVKGTTEFDCAGTVCQKKPEDTTPRKLKKLGRRPSTDDEAEAYNRSRERRKVARQLHKARTVPPITPDVAAKMMLAYAGAAATGVVAGVFVPAKVGFAVYSTYQLARKSPEALKTLKAVARAAKKGDWNTVWSIVDKNKWTVAIMLASVASRNVRGGNSTRKATKGPRTPTDKFKHPTDRKHLSAAGRERKGQVVSRKADGKPFDHVSEVRNAQRGLRKRIVRIKRQLGDSSLSQTQREALTRELGEASRMLDRTRSAVP